MSQVMTIDAEAVAAAVNQIDVAIQDINTRNQKFLEILDNANTQCEGNFPPIPHLIEDIGREAENLKKTQDAVEAIKDSIARYTALAEEAADCSFLH